MVQIRVTLSDERPEAIRPERFGAEGVVAAMVAGVHRRECYPGPAQLEPCRVRLREPSLNCSSHESYVSGCRRRKRHHFRRIWTTFPSNPGSRKRLEIRLGEESDLLDGRTRRKPLRAYFSGNLGGTLRIDRRPLVSSPLPRRPADLMPFASLYTGYRRPTPTLWLASPRPHPIPGV
jgi:hypothetical protein